MPLLLVIITDDRKINVKKELQMIDLLQIFSIVRRWLWLLFLGLFVGLATGYLVSSLQDKTYESSTKLLISNELQGKSSDFAGLTNQQLVLTYIQLLNTQQLRDIASEKSGIKINSSQVRIQQIPDTQIIEIKVESNNPEQAAEIANTLARTLFEQTETMQIEQFSVLEDSLTKQSDEMKKQIAELQDEYDKAFEEIYGGVYQNQLAKVNNQITDIQDELSRLQTEIANLANIRTAEGRAQLAEKEARVVQLQSSFRIYDELRANLLVSGTLTQGNNSPNDAKLQQMKSTIDLYQTIYLDLLSSLETARSNRLLQTPNAVQIQEAFPSVKPIRPIPYYYALLSGIAGLMFSGGVVFLLELRRNKVVPLKDSSKTEEVKTKTGKISG